MFKKIAVTIAAALSLTACGGPSAETYTTNGGFEVATEKADAVDLSGYGTDLYAMYARIGVTDCGPGLAPRDINNAIYLDCTSPVSIRIHEDADVAAEAAERMASVNPDLSVYRTDNYTITGDPASIAYAVEALGGK